VVLKFPPAVWLGSLVTGLALAGGFVVLPQQVGSQINQLSSAIAQNVRRPDNLSTQDWWIDKVKSQATQSQGQYYQNCLFGDSISSGLKNTLGKETVNFAMGGLSSASLATQLKYLSAAGVQCQQAIIAIGTNDAWYITRDDAFIANLRQCLSLVRAMGTSRVFLVPAFYSTLAASYDPTMAGPLQRVDEINVLLRLVARDENVDVVNKGLEPLFRNNALKEELTYDGVHLNDRGNAIYRQVLLQVFQSSP
jgi:lysophospholipase L1-like esterase